MFRSIKAPIGVIVAISLCLVVAFMLLVSINEVAKLYRDSAEHHIGYVTDSLELQLTNTMRGARPNEKLVSDIISSVETLDNVVCVRVYDSDYRIVSEQFGLSVTAEQKARLALLTADNVSLGTIQNKDFLISHKAIGNTLFSSGFVMVFMDYNEPLKDRMYAIVINEFSLALLVSIITIAVCLYAITRKLKPLVALTAFTHNLTQSTDYTARHDYNENNEIGRLSRNINSLLETIEVELLVNQEQNQTLIDQQATMTRLANYDSLTGLPNRQFVFDNMRLELARAKRNDNDIALLFFDLDGFKGINDSLGHETGDLILIEVADRVSKLLRDGDLVARLGGDEFLVVPDRDTSDASLINLATRLIGAFNDPYELRGLSLTVGVSVGIAKAKDARYDLSELMSNADLAMYRSKARGRGSYTIFTTDMVESHKRKLNLANAIEQGLAGNEFAVYYQIKVDQKGQVIGMEALMRWNHPEYGLVSPGEFIPIAEQGGKISSITRWVINRVCLDLPDLKEWLGRKFRVSVNLSGHDLRNSQLFDNIYAIFNRHDINPEYVEFEVTESAYLENFALSNKFFKRLSNMGCAIALDDFGTGYSSLSYLTQISIDTLKIDKQFIRELEHSERSRLVTGSIIDLAKRLSLNVCAEGIENEVQREYLTQHGCDSLQGFLFSKPVPLNELIKVPQRFPVQALDSEEV